MTWLISDANILIDMEVAKCLEIMFRLPERFAVPNILYSEELSASHPDLPAMGLAVLDLHEEYMLEAYKLGDAYRKTSHNDRIAMALAKQEECPLLTGDAKLREAAENEGVDVRGSLWIMERLVEEGLLSYTACRDAYARMKAEERRLPWNEVERQLIRLEGK